METVRTIGAGTVALVLIWALAAAQQPEIPRTWDRMDDFELPLADRSVKDEGSRAAGMGTFLTS
jgi:hypothetical protein